jgi:hypothetical protein
MTKAESETPGAERDDAAAAGAERRVEDRAELIVERVSAQVTAFARRVVARTREEVEDILAEAQSLRRGDRPHGEGHRATTGER